jgi:hypothetical protein
VYSIKKGRDAWDGSETYAECSLENLKGTDHLEDLGTVRSTLVK